MKSRSLLSVVACIAVLVLAPACNVSAAEKVSSERSTAPAQPALRWRSESFPAASVARLQYREMPASAILKVQRHNENSKARTTQIGIGRAAANEAIARSLPTLKWISLSNGGSVTRFDVVSPVALGIRVGLDVRVLNPAAELRFAGSDQPAVPLAMMTGAELRKIADFDGIAWTPATDGERQIIELYIPPRISRSSIIIKTPQVSHLLTNAANDFKMIVKAGESASCNVNVACRVPGGGGADLGVSFVSAKNAVAHMVFNWYKPNPDYNASNPNGPPQFLSGAFICTGTLLADTVTDSQLPYFYSANHCFEGNDDGYPTQDKQKVSNSLITYWNYEAPTCNVVGGLKNNPLTGGAALLYADPDLGTTTTTGTDAMFLRLNGTPPASAEYAGWSSELLASGSNIVGIHHPKGDAKKVSSGQQVTRDNYLTTVAWLSGTTEGGSSGSGLFTADGDGYHLRGGLYGGSASCANTGTVANTSNRDYYSRFDVIFPNIRQWLAPVSATPIRVNGSHPLLHSSVAPVTSSSAASSSPASAAPARKPRLPLSRMIQTGPFEP